ncbi:MAG TPA: hypothetical protein VK487_09845 [Candidatus Bathyarchaeia archaeon]|nr:hypothetical protein [Candidatus Bathyarchaeia archaeon]
MARLQPQTESQSAIEQLKPIAPEIEQKIAYTLIKLKASSGSGDETIKRIGYALTRLAQECNLNDPIETGTFIRDMKHPKTKKEMDNATKNKYANAYKKYCAENGIQWKKPYYRVVEKTPLIPTPRQVQAIIDNSSENYVTIFTIQAEIGCSPKELYQVTQDKINKETGEISITGVKGHASANYKLKPQTKELLLKYLATHPDEHPFPKAHAQSVKWSEFRARAAKKLNDKELLKIDLRNLRNYSGERYYKSLPVRDPILVMRHLRHKKLETTMHYIRAIVLDYEEDDQWISLITRTTEEECKAIEKGYTLVRAIDPTTAIYRKRKC